MVELEATFGVSQRRACKVVGQARSTQRLKVTPPDDEQELRRWLRAFAKESPLGLEAPISTDAARDTG